MDLKDSLTILIPLKGRDYATKRILHQMSQDKVPFKILFADGSGDDNSEWIRNSNLNIEYHNYGLDDSIHKFMRKMDLACSSITTPLTVMIDNDDLFCLDGFISGAKFLAENDDFVSFRENIQEGKDGRPIYSMGPIVSETAPHRILDLFGEGRANGGINSEWHAICRTHVLAKMFKIIHQSKNQDFQLSHSVNKFWNLFFGKSHKGYNKPYIYHIMGDSLVQGKKLYSKYVEWVHDSKFQNSMTIIVSMIRCLLKDYSSDLIQTIQHVIIKDPYYLGKHKIDFDAITNIMKDSYNYDSLIANVLSEPLQTPPSFQIDL